MTKAICKKFAKTPTIKAAFEAGKLEKHDTSYVMVAYENLSRAQTSMETVGLDLARTGPDGWPSTCSVLSGEQLRTLEKFIAMRDELAEIEATLRSYAEGHMAAWKEQLAPLLPA